MKVKVGTNDDVKSGDCDHRCRDDQNYCKYHRVDKYLAGVKEDCSFQL